MLGTNFTYKYVAQSSGAYGTDTYGSQVYSCTGSDVVCQTGGPSAPNTGFLSTQNAPVYIGGFVAVALIVTVVTYLVLRRLKKQAR